MSGSFCRSLTVHSHIHRIEVSSRDPAHLGGGCLAFREVFRDDPRHIFTCLGNPFRNDTMIRAHDCQCGPVQFHSRCVPADPRDLYNILLQNSETSDGFATEFQRFSQAPWQFGLPVQSYSDMLSRSFLLKFFLSYLFSFCCHISFHYSSF